MCGKRIYTDHVSFHFGSSMLPVRGILTFSLTFLQVVAILGDAFPWKVESRNIDCKY